MLMVLNNSPLLTWHQIMSVSFFVHTYPEWYFLTLLSCQAVSSFVGDNTNKAERLPTVLQWTMIVIILHLTWSICLLTKRYNCHLLCSLLHDTQIKLMYLGTKDDGCQGYDVFFAKKNMAVAMQSTQMQHHNTSVRFATCLSQNP